MEYLFANLWILIPLFALLVGAFSEWLKFKEKQNKLGASTHELEATLTDQQQALEAAQRRIQNLEAIVTSQMWDVVHDDTLSEPEKERALAEARIHLAPPPDERSDADKVEQLARRIKL